MEGSFLHRLGDLARRRYRLVFLVTLGLVAVAVALASRLRFDPDFLNLLPQDEPRVATFRRNLEEFGSVDYLLVALRVPEDATLDPYEAVVGQVGEGLVASGVFDEVEYKVGDLEELLVAFMPQSMLFLDAEGRQAVESKLTDEALARRALEIRRLLATPQSLAMKRLVQLDPLGLSEVFLDRLGSARVGLSLDWSSGYLLSRDHRMYLVLAKPQRPPQDIEFSGRVVATAQGEIEKARALWPELGGEIGAPFPEIVLGGRYVIVLSDERVIRNDAVVNVASSLAGVLLVFLLVFRRVGLLLYAFVPLVVGLVATFGVAALTFGVLSSATSGVAALLIGLGIDFVIVSYGRFVEERQAGVAFERALATMCGSSGRAVVAGALTTAGTFAAFAVTEFRGLAEMGLLTCTGILLCMAAVLFLLPAQLAWSHERHRRRDIERRLHVHGLGAGRVVRWSLEHPRTTLAAGGLLTVAAAIAAFGLHFEDSVRAMRPAGTPGTEVWEEVAARFGSGFEQMSLVITAPTVAEVVEIEQRAAAGAERLVAEGVIVDFDGIHRVIPPLDQQRAAVEWLAAGRRGPLDPARVEAVFGEALGRAGLRREAFTDGFALYRGAVMRSQPIGIEDFERSSQARRLLGRYLLETDEGWRSAVYLYPPGRAWTRRPPPQAVALAAELGNRVELTGANVVSDYLRRRVLMDALIAGLLGLALVAVILWLDLRTVRHTAASLTPLAVGMVWMLGGMVALGQPMNFMNIFVTTMIIGIGVDYGIHMVHRYCESEGLLPEHRAAGLVETGKGVALAALTTIVGFGSLATSHYPGLRSMGWVAALGAASTAVAALTLLPAYLGVRLRRRAATDV
jgi:predicted RND superfamily exporter protein